MLDTTFPTALRVLLVEDSLPVRERLRALVEEDGRVRVVGEEATVAGALVSFHDNRPDAVVLDLQLADGSGYAVLEAIQRSAARCPVIVVSNSSSAEVRRRWQLLGVTEFLDKSTEFQRLPGALAELRPKAAAPAPATGAPAVAPDHHYRQMMQSLTQAVYACDAEGRITYFNNAAAALWGREPVLGQDRWTGAWRSFDTDGRPLPAQRCPMAICLRERRPVQGHEIVIERPNGSRHHILHHPQPLFDAQGVLTGAVNTLLDIGPQHRLQSMRKREMHLAQATLDSLTAQVCVLDEMGLIRSVNEAWRTCDTLLPAGAQDVVEGGDYLAACTAESQRQAPGALAFADALSAILSGRSSSYDGEFARDTQSGRKWFMGRIRQLAADGPLHVVVTHFDITARKLAEQTAQDSDKRWRFAIEGSGDGLWDTVLPGGQTLYSPRFKEMLGFAAADIGSSADEWMGRVHEDDWRTMLPLYRACLDGTTPALQCELRLRCRSGGWKWVLVRGLVVARDDHGAPLRVICTSSDIDARKSAEAARIELQAQLQESQKMEAVGTLASSIAHDFNNIVGAILGNAEVALQELAADDPARPSLTQIHKAGLRARSLVQKILSFSRRRPAAMSLQPIGDVVQESVDLLRATLPSGVTLHTELSTDALAVHMDATQISQLLLNLGTNAWHALQGAPGRIEIGLQARVVDTESTPPGVAPGRQAHLWVRDNGCGMDEAVRARIFQPFFTTKSAGTGTGLGLPVVASIVEAHRGALVVQSSPGAGSCFHVYLPATLPEPVTPPAPPRTESMPLDMRGAGQHVLYVDDDETMSLLVELLLPRVGFRVTCMQDGALALEALRAAPLAYDILVTDYSMPGLTGLDVIRAALEIRADLPLIITSGSLSDELMAMAQQAGARGFVCKERTFEDLGDEIVRLLAPVAP